MWTHNLLQLSLVFGCLALHGQTAKVQLSINPDSAPRSAAPASAVFTAEVTSAQTPSSVTLCLVDHSGTVLSTHGDLLDDGVSPDQAASDKKYTLQMQIPVDKVGMFKFIARAQFDPPTGQVDSAVAPFFAAFHTPVNVDGSVVALGGGGAGGNALRYDVDQEGIRKVKLHRSTSSTGPWTQVAENISTEEEGVGVFTIADPDDTAAAADWYYKVELYDSGSVLKQTLPVICVPADAEQDRLLRLTGTPPSSQVVPLQATDPSKKRPNSP